MGRGEGLVQVDMHAVDAEVAGPDPADDRVEIRAVGIDEAAGRMHVTRDGREVVLEQTAGVRIGDHDAGDIGAEPGAQRREVDPPAGIGRDRIHLEAASRGGRRVGAMRRFRHQHPLAALAAMLQRRADRHHAAELAMGAGAGRHGDGRHAGPGLQPMGEAVDQLERALDGGDRLQGMQIGQARQPRHLLVEARVVLHGAGAERIEPRVDRVVLLAEPRVVPHHLGLREAGEPDRPLAPQAAQALAIASRRGQIDAGAPLLSLLEDERLLDRQTAVPGEGAGLAARQGRRHVRAHRSTSARPPASASISASVVHSLAATRSRRSSSGRPG